jgi:aminopeptidase N
VTGTRQRIRNDRPIIGIYNVHYQGSGDMYCKGANMLHTLRQIVDDDEKWRIILRGLNKEFYHQTVNAQQIEDYLSKHTGKDLSAFFDQYLRDVKIPILEYVIKENEFRYRWSNCVRNFDMPVRVTLNDSVQWISPSTRWRRLETPSEITKFVIDPNFYVASFHLTGQQEL